MPNNYEKAKRILDKRREDAEWAAEQKREELEARSPELRRVNHQISQAGLQALSAITHGLDAPSTLAVLKERNLDLEQKQKALLAELGEPADALKVHYHCEKCEDTGVYNHHYCDCFLELVKKLSYDELNASAPAKNCSFGSFTLERYKGMTDPETGEDVFDHMSQIRQFCMDWAADFGKGSPSLLLYGKTGLGKTHLSLAMANAVIEKGYHVLYGSTYNLLSDIERERFNKQQFEESPEKLVLEADLLILDDLGAEFNSKFNKAAIYNIINTRELTGSPTIISTNLMYDEIAREYDERVYSRIMGSYIPLLFMGHDGRQYE